MTQYRIQHFANDAYRRSSGAPAAGHQAGLWHTVHFHSLGPGGLPSVPA